MVEKTEKMKINVKKNKKLKWIKTKLKFKYNYRLLFISRQKFISLNDKK